jgi:hypothetical protein
MNFPTSILYSICEEIQKDPDFNGCMIGCYHSDGYSFELHPGNKNSRNYYARSVILEPSFIKSEAESYVNQPAKSNIYAELIGAGLSCGFTIVSAAGLVASLGGTLPTGGLSTGLVIASWTGVITGYAQCINGAYRIGEAISDPTLRSLQKLDGNWYYSKGTQLIDIVGLIAGVWGLQNVGKQVMKKLQSMRISAETRKMLQSAQTRKELSRGIKRAVDEIVQTNSEKELINGIITEISGKNWFFISTGLVNFKKDISKKIIKELNPTLRDSIDTIVNDNRSFFASIAANAAPNNVTGSSSGLVNDAIEGAFELVFNIIEND